MTADASSIHASAVLVGAKAVLIRGPSGSGKSRLAWDLLSAAQHSTGFGALPFARLVIDDRATMHRAHGDYDRSESRVLWRILVEGDKPRLV